MRFLLYFSREVAWRTTIAAVLLVLLYAVIDVVEVNAVSVTPGDGIVGLRFYLLRVPYIAAVMLPLAITLGVQLTLWSLKQRGEWDALGVAGISPRRRALNLFGVPIVGMLIQAGLLTHIAPPLLKKWEARTATSSALPDSGAGRWCREKNGLKRAANGSSPELIIKQEASGRPTEWVMLEARKRRILERWRREEDWLASPGFRSSEQGCLPTVRHHVATRGSFWPGAGLSWSELRRFVDSVEKRGLNPSFFEAQLALRVALVLSCLVIPLTAAVFGFMRKSRSAVYVTGVGIAACGLYWVVLSTIWHGAAMGVWPACLVACGVPGGFIMLACLLAFLPSYERK